ncbi:DUF6516 family protein [Halorussus salilacus]|uniref:toxin-antitoxin system TumE family protein n=1 Tax=Halorussus salilacus TaxID=2953750 RepID=UPI0020A1485D|nr:DUF6516 family protein [Halorussus salilacus]USZ68596.1 DUF6516 family protein [Halorussus salilacus]
MAGEDVLLTYTDKRPDGTVESVTVRQTDDETYPCGWKYRLHFGTTDGETILRYDNSHELTKGHERHVGDGETERTEEIDFPGMDALLERFVREVEERR